MLLTCKCHSPVCNSCLKCSRCECEHDGKSIESKINRKRGRKSRSAENDCREIVPLSSDINESVASSDIFHRETRPKRARLSSSSDETRISNSTVIEKVDSDSEACRSNISDISRLCMALGIPLDSSVVKKLPSFQKRHSRNLWASDDVAQNDSVKKIADFIEKVFLSATEIVCGSKVCDRAASCILPLLTSRLCDKLSKVKIESKNDEVERSIHLRDSLTAAFVSSSIRSPEYYIMRALLSNSFQWDDLNRSLREIGGSNISFRGFSRGRKDAVQLIKGEPLEYYPNSRKSRFCQESVDEALSFSLSGNMVNYTSWGSKRVRLDGVWKILPFIPRKFSISKSFQMYKSSEEIAQSNHPPLSRASFYRLLSTVTHGSSQLRAAVDYVVGFLVNDNFDNLMRVINHFYTNQQEKKKIVCEVERLKLYLKYGFDQIITRTHHSTSAPACLIHDMGHALGSTASSCVDVCELCIRLFSFRDVVGSHIVMTNDRDERTTKSAMTALNGFITKATLFMGHRVRVINQHIAIQELIEGLKERCNSNNPQEGHLVIDFKMKMDPIYYREKTVDHYGKRGISYHGAMLQFYRLENGIPIQEKIYIDQVCGNDSKQDRLAVLSLMEDLLLTIKREFPTIKRISIQSDNAGCYQNSMLVIMLPLLSQAHGIEIVRFIHTETQDGKSILDAHFARSMQTIVDYCKQGHNCITPSQVVTALQSNQMANCVSQLIIHDRERLTKLEEYYDTIDKQLKKFIGRSNDILFTWESAPKRIPNTTQLMSILPHASVFTLTSFDHSNQGPGTVVKVDPVAKTCSIINGHQSRSEDVNCDELDEEDDDISTCWREQCEESDEESLLSDSEQEESTPVEQIRDQEIGIISGIKVCDITKLCRRERWRRKKVYQTGLVPIQGLSDNTHRGLLSYGVKKTLEMVNVGAVRVVTISDASEYHENLLPLPHSFKKESVLNYFQKSWAKRPPRGHMYGEKYVEYYRDEIREMYEAGNAEKSEKKSPAQMLGIISAKYPNEFCLPGENDIRTEISRLMAQKKSGSRSTAREDVPARSRQANKQSSMDIKTFFEELIRSNPEMKPAEALLKVKQSFPGTHNQSDQQLKAKFSSVKAKLKLR